jgi:hypothetical protein
MLVLWSLIFGRHPFIRELPQLILVSFSILLAMRGWRMSRLDYIAFSLLISEAAFGITLGWWSGREFEGKTRPLLSIVLSITMIYWFSMQKISIRLHDLPISRYDRLSALLFSVALGLVCFKFDIERRAPWTQEAVFELHPGSQVILPVMIAWLFSASIVLLYLSKLQRQTS